MDHLQKTDILEKEVKGMLVKHVFGKCAYISDAEAEMAYIRVDGRKTEAIEVTAPCSLFVTKADRATLSCKETHATDSIDIQLKDKDVVYFDTGDCFTIEVPAGYCAEFTIFQSKK